jgi:hypothetical protein
MEGGHRCVLEPGDPRANNPSVGSSGQHNALGTPIGLFRRLARAPCCLASVRTACWRAAGRRRSPAEVLVGDATPASTSLPEPE